MGRRFIEVVARSITGTLVLNFVWLIAEYIGEPVPRLKDYLALIAAGGFFVFSAGLVSSCYQRPLPLFGVVSTLVPILWLQLWSLDEAGRFLVAGSVGMALGGLFKLIVREDSRCQISKKDSDVITERTIQKPVTSGSTPSANRASTSHPTGDTSQQGNPTSRPARERTPPPPTPSSSNAGSVGRGPSSRN